MISFRQGPCARVRSCLHLSIILALLIVSFLPLAVPSVRAADRILAIWSLYSANAAVSPTAAASSTATGVTTGDLSAYGLGAPLNFGGSLAFAGWADSATADPAKYMEWSITPQGAPSLTYTTISYTLISNANSSSGPQTFNLRASTDNFVTSDIDIYTQTMDGRGSQAVTDADISVLGTQSGTVTFRLYGYSPGTTSFGGLYYRSDEELPAIIIKGMVDGLSVPSATIYVDASATGTHTGQNWTDAYTSLRSALTAASSGDQIWVAAGTYIPTMIGIREASFTLKEGVEVYGGFAGNETALDQRDWHTNTTILSGDLFEDDGTNFANNGDNSYHVVTGATGALLDGFTISGGNAADPIFKGGGIYNNGVSPTLRNLIVSGNSASDGGAGIYVNGGNPILNNITISGNKAAYGGGIYFEGGSTATLTGMTISGNSASQRGGGLYTSNSSPTLTDMMIRGNDAHMGGGLEVFGGSPIFTNVSITANTAGEAGGIMLRGNTTAILTSTTINGNTASNRGGGLYSENSTPILTNVIISGNQAGNMGGGIVNEFQSIPTLTNVTISGNRAEGMGGAIFSSYLMKVRNSIIWGNSPSGTTDDARVTISYSIVEGGYNGTGNLNADPQFVTVVPAAPSTGGDLHLQATSPAIDAGDNEVLNPGLAITDYDGNARTFDVALVNDTGNGTAPIVDIGAYESQSNSINQAPSLNQLNALAILEDAGEQVIPLAGISAGPGESQALTISADSSNPALLTPSVSYTSPENSGSLRFTPAADANGSAVVTITVQDNGGTVNGGVNTLVRSFTVTVTPVNDAPDFTIGANQSVIASAGPQTVTGWTTGFTPGPSNEAGQTVQGYTVVSNTAPELFAVSPVIDASGTLAYTPKPGMSGTATLSVLVQDNGGTANGGIDTSPAHEFSITISGNYTAYLPLVLR